jgi:hypothetical protein
VVAVKSFALDFYGGMLWCVDKCPANDIRDTSSPNNILLVKPRLDFDKYGYDSRGLLIALYRGPVEFDLTEIFGIPLPITVKAWEGSVSSFGPIRADAYGHLPEHSGMHVDTWLSMGNPTGKLANNVFGLMKTGDAGVGQNSVSNLDLAINTKIYLNYWAHNMRRSLNPLGADDWHCGYTIYYES